MKVRLAVVGSGFGLYGLLPAFQKIPECIITGICGRNSERMVNYCQKTFVPRIFQDWRELIEESKPDAIAVAVVPQYQQEIIMHALRRGISVFAEKPLSVNLEQAEELLMCARINRLPNMIDFIFPEIPEWKNVKELLKNNIIGKIIHVTVNWSFLSYDIKNRIETWKSNPEEGGGALSFYFSHVFYNLEFFLGKIETLQCDLNYSPNSFGNGETVVSMLVRWESGCTGNIVLNCSSVGINKYAWEFQGQKGDLVLQNNTESTVTGFEVIHYNANGKKVIIAPARSKVFSDEDERVCLVKSLGERFIAWHLGGEPSKPDFEDAVRVQQLIKYALNSANSNRLLKS
jgi:predicted dehydrogenase